MSNVELINFECRRVEAGLRRAFYLMGVVESFWGKGLQVELGVDYVV